jgi:ArsR family transcriptional regulator
MNVQELVESTGQSQANVSKHLGLLVKDGVVRRRKDGLYAYFCIDDPSLSGLCLLVCGQIRDREEANGRSGA